MQIVTKEIFDAFIGERVTLSETSMERDGEFAYESWLDMDGDEIATVTYRGGEAIAWAIA